MEIKDVKPHSRTTGDERREAPIVVERKKTVGERIMDTIFNRDFDTVKKHIIGNVIIPGALNYISGSFHDVIDAIFGRNGSGTGYSSGGSYYRSANGVQYVNYNKVSNNQSTTSYVMPRSEMHDKLNSFAFASRQGAYDTLQDMLDILEKDGKVSVGHLLDIVQRRPAGTDFNWGWTDLRDARVRECEDGYRILFPEPYVIK